jgi:hypothetical protein
MRSLDKGRAVSSCQRDTQSVGALTPCSCPARGRATLTGSADQRPPTPVSLGLRTLKTKCPPASLGMFRPRAGCPARPYRWPATLPQREASQSPGVHTTTHRLSHHSSPQRRLEFADRELSLMVRSLARRHLGQVMKPSAPTARIGPLPHDPCPPSLLSASPPLVSAPSATSRHHHHQPHRDGRSPRNPLHGNPLHGHDPSSRDG